ncbi:MAG TPA: hypothetical protein VNV66_13670 [Pilimelia sp.]|nr:hypothetical protein [Pilimelia sp.]
MTARRNTARCTRLRRRDIFTAASLRGATPAAQLLDDATGHNSRGRVRKDLQRLDDRRQRVRGLL